MIVLDASALVELVLGTASGRGIAARVADPAVSLHAPHLADVEVAQTLRRYTRDGELDALDARAALDDFRALDLQRHAHEPLLDRVWALRENLSAGLRGTRRGPRRRAAHLRRPAGARTKLCGACRAGSAQARVAQTCCELVLVW